MARYRNITVKIEADLYKEVQAQFKQRGTAIENFVKLQLIAFAKNKTIIDLGDKMPFGKYAGALVEDVIRGDPKYSMWLMSQDFATKLSSDAMELIQNINGVE